MSHLTLTGACTVGRHLAVQSSRFNLTFHKFITMQNHIMFNSFIGLKPAPPLMSYGKVEKLCISNQLVPSIRSRCVEGGHY